MMRIVVCADARFAERCADALARRLPDAHVHVRDREASADPSAPVADYALVWRPPAVLFEEQRRLRAVFNLGAGVDGVLALPTLPPDVPLFRLEDAGMAEPMADYVLWAVLRAHRRFDVYARQQSTGDWTSAPVVPKREFRVGVLGLGAIGAHVAARLAVHGFAVRGFARTPRTLPHVECVAGDARDGDPGFVAFLDGLDVLVNILPNTAHTRGALNRGALGRLAPGAHVVNVGRGPQLVEADLLALLEAGTLGGAVLDVFETEPLPPGHPLRARADVVVTPHVSAATDVEGAIAQIVDKLARFARGEEPGGRVDRRRGY